MTTARARREAGFMGRRAGGSTVARVPAGRKSRPAGLGQVQPQGLDELLHGRREDPALAVQYGERAGELPPLEPEHGERALGSLLDDGRLRHDRDPVVDLDRALHRLDVVEFHDRLYLHAVVPENLVHGLPGRDVRVEADELLPGELGDRHLAALCERVLGVADDDEVVVAERDALYLADIGRKRHEPEVDAVVDDVLVDHVRPPVLDAHVDRGEVMEEPLDVGRELVEPYGVDGRDADRPAHHLLHPLELRDEPFVGMKDVLRRLVDPLPLARQLELLLAAVAQYRLEVPLHRAGLLAPGGLGDIVQLRGLGEALGLDEIREDFEVVYLHEKRALLASGYRAGHSRKPRSSLSNDLMFPDYEEFKRRADAVRSMIGEACARAGRNPADVELLAVTKSQPALAAEFAARYGLRAVGENRVQEAVAKRAQTTAAVAWELIGHLQSNKARLAALHFDRIQSVDSVRLVEILDREAGALGKALPVLLQVNAGLDPAKSGVE